MALNVSNLNHFSYVFGCQVIDWEKHYNRCLVHEVSEVILIYFIVFIELIKFFLFKYAIYISLIGKFFLEMIIKPDLFNIYQRSEDFF